MSWHLSDLVHSNLESQYNLAINPRNSLDTILTNHTSETSFHAVEIQAISTTAIATSSARAPAIQGIVAHLSTYCRGYVALAVATEKGTTTREADTGLGGDRKENMVAFAIEGLKLLRDVIQANPKL